MDRSIERPPGNVPGRRRRRARRRWARPVAALGLAMTAAGWAVLWNVESYWNPLAFAAMWTGAALAMWGASRDGYPGVSRHAGLAALSVPLWWWFELVNARVHNWEYVYPFHYGSVEWAVLSSVAFATVIPAVVAATSLVRRILKPPAPESVPASVGAGRRLLVAGVAAQIAVVAFPVQLYPLVWVAPFLALDGLLVLSGGRSMAVDMARGHWREAIVIGAAGLLCGVLWEFWNYWATPKWVYHIPLLGFGKVFEMPVLGYAGYVPFAWSIARLVEWVDVLSARARARRRPERAVA